MKPAPPSANTLRICLPRFAAARRPGEIHLLRLEAEVGVVEGIFEKDAAPSSLHVLALASEALALLRRVLAPAAHRLVVVEEREGRPYVAIPGFPYPDAEIDVVESYRQVPLVQTAHLLVDRFAHREAGPSDGAQALREKGTPEVALGIARAPAEDVSGHPVQSEQDAGVLDRLVRVEQLGADATDHTPEPL